MARKVYVKHSHLIAVLLSLVLESPISMAAQIEDVVSSIERLAEKLEHPLSQVDVDNGWSEECRVSTLLFLRTLKENALRSEYMPNMSLSRSLDHWGVVNGDLLEEAARLSNVYRDFVEKSGSGSN